MNYEVVIGVEVHAQLRTKSKMFCGCGATFGLSANSQTCPVCLGLPGSLPVINRTAVEMAVRAGLALNCTIGEQNRLLERTTSTPIFRRAIRYRSTNLPSASMAGSRSQPVQGKNVSGSGVRILKKTPARISMRQKQAVAWSI